MIVISIQIKKENSMPANRYQFKSYSTRRFRSDLHERMKLFAAIMGTSIEDAFNMIMERGLDSLEKETKLTASMPGNVKYK